MSKKNEKKYICTICKKNETTSPIWCADCYSDFALANHVFGEDAIRKYQEMNKRMDLTPVLREPKEVFYDD